MRQPILLASNDSALMVTCVQSIPVGTPATRTPMRALLLVALAIGLPLLAGLAWHQASDNPVWPLLRNSLNLCELRNAPLSPLSPDGLYRARVVQASCFGRFEETLVFITGASDPWQLSEMDPNRAVLEIAGRRSLDAIDWQETSSGSGSVLQLWFLRGVADTQIHHLERAWRDVIVQPLTSAPAPGAERLDY